jgi:hypothetical protein
MLGMRIKKGKRSRKAAFWMTVVMPLFQFPASAARIFYSFTDSFTLANPMATYIDLLWSPICTLFIIWLYRKHLIRSCAACELNVPKESIACRIDPKRIFAAFLAGFLTPLSLYPLFIVELPQRIVGLFYWLITFCAAGAMAEIVLTRVVHGRIALISYSWLWYLGAGLMKIMLQRRRRFHSIFLPGSCPMKGSFS